MLQNSVEDISGFKSGAAEEPPFEIISGDFRKGLVLICDHASNEVPDDYNQLGLDREVLHRHIGYDVGAGALTRALSALTEAPAVLSRFSRLLIDPNRGPDDPTLLMQISDGHIIPGNRSLSAEEVRRRRRRFYDPYHNAIDDMMASAMASGTIPALLSIHSYTPRWRGVDRPWHAGVLWDRDPRLAVPLIDALREDGDLVVGDNEPYSGKLEGDTMYRHGTVRGIAHALLEVRQDLIDTDDGVARWAQRLAGLLPRLMAADGLHKIIMDDRVRAANPAS